MTELLKVSNIKFDYANLVDYYFMKEIKRRFYKLVEHTIHENTTMIKLYDNIYIFVRDLGGIERDLLRFYRVYESHEHMFRAVKDPKSERELILCMIATNNYNNIYVKRLLYLIRQYLHTSQPHLAYICMTNFELNREPIYNITDFPLSDTSVEIRLIDEHENIDSINVRRFDLPNLEIFRNNDTLDFDLIDRDLFINCKEKIKNSLCLPDINIPISTRCKSFESIEDYLGFMQDISTPKMNVFELNDDIRTIFDKICYLLHRFGVINNIGEFEQYIWEAFLNKINSRLIM
jgi:hypothetical protein